MNRAKIRILKQVDQKRLRRLLQRHDRLALPSQVAQAGGANAQRDFAHQPREGQLQEQKVGAALVFADFAQRGGTGFVAALLGWAGWGVACWEVVSIAEAGVDGSCSFGA